MRLIRRARRATYAEILAAYLRWAACLDTPSIARISDQERSALCIADGVGQGRVDVSLFHQFGNGPKHCRVRIDEIIGGDVVGPTLG